MDTIEQSGDAIEFRRSVPAGMRVCLLAASLLPLLAPYELLIKPDWRERAGLFWCLSLIVAGGALAVSLLLAGAAIFGTSQRVRFDSASRTVAHRAKQAFGSERVQRHPFAAIEAIELRAHEWSDGPTTYNLVLRLEARRPIEFGRFTAREQAEAYLQLVRHMTER